MSVTFLPSFHSIISFNCMIYWRFKFHLIYFSIIYWNMLIILYMYFFTWFYIWGRTSNLPGFQILSSEISKIVNYFPPSANHSWYVKLKLYISLNTVVAVVCEYLLAFIFHSGPLFNFFPESACLYYNHKKMEQSLSLFAMATMWFVFHWIYCLWLCNHWRLSVC